MRYVGPRGEDFPPRKTVFIAAAATTLVKTGPGRLLLLVVGDGIASTTTAYDSLTGSGTILAQLVQVPTQTPPVHIPAFIPFTVGLTVVTTAGSKVTVVYD